MYIYICTYTKDDWIYNLPNELNAIIGYLSSLVCNLFIH